MNDKPILIFASKSPDQSYYPEEIIENLEEFYAGLEYGDVHEGEYQVWEYPSGQIYQLESDRDVSKDQYYSTPHGKNGVIWLPKLRKISEDKAKVESAHIKLQSR